MSEHDRLREDVGAYLLGALEPAEQAAFEQHLAGCPECRVEVDELRAAAEALPRSVEPFTAPASLKRSIMRAVREESEERATKRRPLLERLGLDRLRTGIRPELAWVSAAVVLALGIALGAAVTQLSSNGGPERRVVTAAVDSSRVRNASATLTIPAGGSGPAQLRVSGMPPPKPGQVYEIWLKRGDQPQPGPLFDVDSKGNGVGAIPGDLKGVSVVLVTRERTGGAQRPSEVPIVSARI